jgi:hypothetical protein
MAHGDYTGQAKTRLAQKYAEEQQLAASQMSLVTQVVQEGQNEAVDLWTHKDDEALQDFQQRQSEGGDVVSVDADASQFDKVKFRAAEDLDQVTVGQGREFSLKGGRTYIAPRWVVEHLDDKGLVWH